MQIKKITKLDGQDHKTNEDKLYEVEAEETRNRFVSLAHLRRHKTALEAELAFVNEQIQQIETQQAPA